MINVKNGPLYQWDLNRLIEIYDPENKIKEIHCCNEGSEEAFITPFTRSGDTIEAVIPNLLLQSSERVIVFVVCGENDEVKTTDYRVFHVFSRQKPSQYICDETETPSYSTLIKELKEALANKADLDEYGKVKSEQLPELAGGSIDLTQAVNSALAQAKASGEFNGKDGTSVKVVSVTESAQDSGSNEVHFSDGTFVVIRNGSKGADGYTPLKGIDYFTNTETAEIKNEFAAEVITQNTGSSTDKVMSQYAVTKALETLVVLPYGGSKDWLESNGDREKLYQMGGYVWGYVESDGWTKSDARFLVVSSIGQMTNAGGTPYLLRNGNQGTVYAYTEAGGDADVPVYTVLPETANEGDIVAVGGRKYKASITTNQVPDYFNLANPLSSEWVKNSRISGSASGTGYVTTLDGYEVTNIIGEVLAGDVIRVKGLDLTSNNAKVCMCLGPDDVTPDADGVGTLSQLTMNATVISSTSEETSFTSQKSGFWRFSGVPNGSSQDIIITVNEEIKTKNEISVTWTDIGEYIPSVAAGWNATDEVYVVIDSLSATADSGVSAVFSSDGYIYTYIENAAWMQMSKYNSPSLYVDGELSDVSTNAVQNRKVTEAINELNAKTKTNANDITAINEKLADIETGSGNATIPSFWQSAVDETIAKIKVLQIGKNCVTFPFFSDNHQRNGYAGILISYIMKECGIPYCFFGGDTISSSHLNESEMIAQDKAFDSSMSYIPEGRFCRAVGNHDGYWNDNGNKGYYTRAQVYELFLRAEGVSQNKHFGEDGTYYYVDDMASKVRFVVLNTNSKIITAGSESIDSTQLSWLQNTALSFDERGWGVVIISHCPISNHYHANVTNAQEVISSVNSSGADIIGWFSGHIHRDRMYGYLAQNGTDNFEGDDYSALGFTEVIITSDNTSIAYEDDTKHETANDDLSHAIDFVTINKDSRKVNITRLGIGNDRVYYY